jgi:hypothetical protein
LNTVIYGRQPAGDDMGIAGESGDAVIRIRVQRLDPLTGTAASEAGAELGFEGWMELIGAVANLIGSPDRPDITDQRATSMSPEQRAEA